MKTFHFTQTQIVKADIDTVWSFFSSPRNLSNITPPSMNFEIIDIGSTEEMENGQLIKYKVSPFPFLRVSWVTEINHIQPKKFFADNQIKGPFAMWYHEHTFTPIAGGVEMKDHVTYSIPLGFIGVLVNKLIVRHRVQKIFDYRKKRIELIFPEKIWSKSF
jgi:ligand-binding SRPBCC domain-containing protein